MDEEYYGNVGDWEAQDGNMVVYWPPHRHQGHDINLI